MNKLPSCLPLAGCVLTMFCIAFAQSEDRCSGAGANPWVYNFEVDGRPAKVINDAGIAFPISGSPILEKELAARAQRLRFMNDSILHLDVNVLYIDRTDGPMLIDTGSGPNEGTFKGSLLKSLHAEGIDPESIKTILLSHADPDHINGIMDSLETFNVAYPKATVYISKDHYDYWTTDPFVYGDRPFTPESGKERAEAVRKIFHKIKKHLKKFDFDKEIIPGIKAISTPWHVPGHASFVINDGDSKLLYAGDAVTLITQSIEDPRFTFGFDYNKTTAPHMRAGFLDMVAEKRWKLFSVHATHPGLMHVSQLGLGFQVTLEQYRGSADTVSVCLGEDMGSYGG